MKTTAAPTVTRLRKGVEPELPKTVWLAPAPKAAPISLPRPVCMRIIMIRAMATMTCKIAITVIIPFPLETPYNKLREGICF